MRLLLDTQLLLWAGSQPDRVPLGARALMADLDNELRFSSVSIWEVAIKHALGRADFPFDPRVVRRGLLENGYGEVSVTGEHALAVASLPRPHKDPFDRMLVAQALVEGITLVSTDAKLASYPGSVRIFV